MPKVDAKFASSQLHRCVTVAASLPASLPAFLGEPFELLDLLLDQHGLEGQKHLVLEAFVVDVVVEAEFVGISFCLHLSLKIQ